MIYIKHTLLAGTESVAGQLAASRSVGLAGRQPVGRYDCIGPVEAASLSLVTADASERASAGANLRRSLIVLSRLALAPSDLSARRQRERESSSQSQSKSTKKSARSLARTTIIIKASQKSPPPRLKSKCGPGSRRGPRALHSTRLSSEGVAAESNERTATVARSLPPRNQTSKQTDQRSPTLCACAVHSHTLKTQQTGQRLWSRARSLSLCLSCSLSSDRRRSRWGPASGVRGKAERWWGALARGPQRVPGTASGSIFLLQQVRERRRRRLRRRLWHWFGPAQEP